MKNPGDLGCTCYRLRQTARLVSRTYDSFLLPCGISIGQFGVLATLDAMNESSLSLLAEVLSMERTTLTRNLLPLEKLGYIRSEKGPDKRFRSLSLTRTGASTLAKAKPLWRAAQKSLEEQLGRKQTRILNGVLDRAAERLSSEPSPTAHNA